MGAPPEHRHPQQHKQQSSSTVVAPQASSSAGPKVVKTPIATTTPEEHPSNGQYHPTAEKLAVRNKNRQGASHSSSAHHRRSGSHGSGNFNYLQQEGNSPRISPLRDRRKSSASTPRQSRLLSPVEPDLIPHHHRSVLSGDYSTASESDDDKLNRTTSVRRVPSVGNGVSGPPSATSSFSR